MIYGFTGPEDGLLDAQVDPLYRLLANCTEFHHGACVGADETAVAMAIEVSLEKREALLPAWLSGRIVPVLIVAHPAIIGSMQGCVREDQQSQDALLQSNVICHPELVLKRNKRIAGAGIQTLIATPSGFKEQVRSGTWATMRYAAALNVPVQAIWPDGEVSYWRPSHG